MSAVDVSDWGEILVSDLFPVIERATRRTMNNYRDGSVPYVTNSSFNNGVTGHLEPKHSDDIEQGSCISVNTVDGSTFWQEKNFLANSSGNGLILLRHPDLNSYRALFLCAAISASLDPSFTVMLTMETVRNLPVRIPMTPEGGPDWILMEQTMRALASKQERELDLLLKVASKEPSKFPTGEWAGFRIDQKFDVVKGSRLTTADMKPGEIRHIGASQFDNGITAMISNNERLHPGNVLTVCYDGPVGTTFYQPEQFWATDAVNVLYPKFELDELIALFLIPVIQAAGSAYNYGEKWGAAAMKSTIIRLPVDPAGVPDWSFMRQTMRIILGERQTALASLQRLMTPEFDA